ncbi:MAG: hypothetical protein V4538_01765 [Bacteroidota bacterium]
MYEALKDIIGAGIKTTGTKDNSTSTIYIKEAFKYSIKNEGDGIVYLDGMPLEPGYTDSAECNIPMSGNINIEFAEGATTYRVRVSIVSAIRSSKTS